MRKHKTNTKYNDTALGKLKICTREKQRPFFLIKSLPNCYLTLINNEDNLRTLIMV